MAGQSEVGCICGCYLYWTIWTVQDSSANNCPLWCIKKAKMDSTYIHRRACELWVHKMGLSQSYKKSVLPSWKTTKILLFSYFCSLKSYFSPTFLRILVLLFSYFFTWVYLKAWNWQNSQNAILPPICGISMNFNSVKIWEILLSTWQIYIYPGFQVDPGEKVGEK